MVIGCMPGIVAGTRVWAWRVGGGLVVGWCGFETLKRKHRYFLELFVLFIPLPFGADPEIANVKWVF